MGDLIVTCTSTLSRNHTVGFRVGRGEPVGDILASTEQVAEGVETTRSIRQLARNSGVEVPIVSEVHAVLFEEKAPRRAVEDLMARESKDERA
jgi:glycerol-3-phosphate dehydrogenase (NAD(P)+)